MILECTYLLSLISPLSITPLFYSHRFPLNSETYRNIKPFEYKHTNLRIQPIQTKTYNQYGYGWECVGVGQFREGTNDLHGVGIQVDSWGDIQEGYWKYGRLHGQGRNIWVGGDYYIGEFKEGFMHGQGTRYNKDGAVYQSGEWKENSFVG